MRIVAVPIRVCDDRFCSAAIIFEAHEMAFRVINGFRPLGEEDIGQHPNQYGECRQQRRSRRPRRPGVKPGFMDAPASGEYYRSDRLPLGGDVFMTTPPFVESGKEVRLLPRQSGENCPAAPGAMLPRPTERF